MWIRFANASGWWIIFISRQGWTSGHPGEWVFIPSREIPDWAIKPAAEFAITVKTA
jgi:hypothetical protein